MIVAAALIPVPGGAGCSKPKAAIAAPPPPTVTFTAPILREVTDSEDFVGQSVAVKTVEVRARVTGYLDKVNFEDGSEVKQDTLLFEIDPRPYEAEVARTEASVTQAEARQKRLEADYRRAQSLMAREVLPREEFDRIVGDLAEAAASVGISKANRDLSKLNLSFTKVHAPIGGRLSRRLVDPGNLVKIDETALTTIVALDPMYVTFDVDERTLLRLRRLINEGKIKSRQEAEVPIFCALADEQEFTRRGTINFSENRLDASTGTLRVRAVLPNPVPRAYTPGMFMKVRLPVGQPRMATLVPEAALGTDQGAKFLYVLDKDDKVVQRSNLKVGNLYFNRYRELLDDPDSSRKIALEDRVVVSGLQRVRAGMKVEPKVDPDMKALAEGRPAPAKQSTSE